MAFLNLVDTGIVSVTITKVINTYTWASTFYPNEIGKGLKAPIQQYFGKHFTVSVRHSLGKDEWTRDEDI